MSGKGSTRRPKQITEAELDARWAMAFGPPIVLVEGEEWDARTHLKPEAEVFEWQHFEWQPGG